MVCQSLFQSNVGMSEGACAVGMNRIIGMRNGHHKASVNGDTTYRPLGFSFSYGSFFRSAISIILVSYFKPSSSRMIATFHGFGPDAWEYRVIG